MSSEIAIKVENLSKCYQIYDQPRDRLKQFILPRLRGMVGLPSKQYFREFWALKDVSFEVKKGETFGIIGRNGSGKSTLLQMICGTLNPSSGSIQAHGRIAALLELGSGFNPEFTGRENIYMNAAVLGLSNEEIDQRFDEIVAFADIGDFIEQPVKTYSSGMMVRLAFAVAINVEPEILIVDEALSVGDELFQRKCFSKIDSIRNRGSTIIFVSHSAAQIVELCDRVSLIDSGEMLIEGLPRHIVTLYQKFLFAAPDKRQAIREEAVASISLKSLAIGKDEIFSQEKSDCEAEDFFDPALKPADSLTYESRGGEIRDVGIYACDRRRVNILRRGGRYIYSYSVSFLSSAQFVRFAMAIRTTSGMFLAGSYSAPSASEALAYVDAGSLIRVDFEFDCVLNPGVYFLNAAAFGVVDDEEVILCRIVDAAALRVMPVSNDIATGYQWISAAPTIYWE